MSVTYGFYNSISGDRKYNAEQMSSIFDGIIKDGVFMSIDDGLIVSAAAGMNINVGLGKAWFNHTWTCNDSLLVLTVDPSDVILNRIDTVVLEVNSNQDVRANSIKIIKGTPGSNPVGPVLTKSLTVNQYPLADIYVGAGVTSITAANITNRVGTSDCPFVSGILDTIDANTLFSKWDGDFNTWFDSVKSTLDGDTAGNLLNLINENAADAMYQTAGGTGTALTLTINETLASGLPIHFVASANNGGAATTINGKHLYKPGTTTAPNLTAGKAYDAWYNAASDCFFIKASAEGTAGVGDVLAGKTFSNDSDTGLAGTIVNYSYSAIGTYKSPKSLKGDGGGHICIQLYPGYYDDILSSNGFGAVMATDANYIAANIAAGKSIFSVAGTFTNDATAVAGNIVNGYSAYAKGVKLNGGIPNRGGATTVIPSSVDQVKLAGYYSGDITIKGAVVLSAAWDDEKVCVADEDITKDDLIELRTYGSIDSGASPLPSSNIDVPLPDIANMEWSLDGKYLAVVLKSSPYFAIYRKDPNDRFTKLANPATLPTTAQDILKWSPNGKYLAITTSSGLNHPIVYSLVSDVITALPNYSANLGEKYFAWNKDSNVLITVTLASGSAWSIYAYSVDDAVGLTQISTRQIYSNTTSAPVVYDAYYDYTNNLLYVVGNNLLSGSGQVFVEITLDNNGSWVSQRTLPVATTNAAYSIAYNAQKNIFVIGVSTGTTVRIWVYDRNTGTAYSVTYPGTVINTMTVRRLEWSADGQYLLLGGGVSYTSTLWALLKYDDITKTFTDVTILSPPTYVSGALGFSPTLDYFGFGCSDVTTTSNLEFYKMTPIDKVNKCVSISNAQVKIQQSTYSFYGIGIAMESQTAGNNIKVDMFDPINNILAN